MRSPRPYPPDWCDATTMAYMLDMGVSTFQSYVASGLLPQGVKIGGLRRWSREAVVQALADLDASGLDAGTGDPILEAARGKTTGGRRATAAARP